jgi:hypothetical protein
MRTYQTATAVIFFLGAALAHASQIEYVRLTDTTQTFELGEGDIAIPIGTTRHNNGYAVELTFEQVVYRYFIPTHEVFYPPTLVGPGTIRLDGSYTDPPMVSFEVTRAETTPTVSPTSAAASSMLSGWTWMETYPLIFNESSDTWFYLMPVVIDGTATNWLYNYSTEEWTPLATE